MQAVWACTNEEAGLSRRPLRPAQRLHVETLIPAPRGLLADAHTRPGTAETAIHPRPNRAASPARISRAPRQGVGASWTRRTWVEHPVTRHSDIVGRGAGSRRGRTTDRARGTRGRTRRELLGGHRELLTSDVTHRPTTANPRQTDEHSKHHQDATHQ